MTTQFGLDAPEQTIWQRQTPDTKSLFHHSDRGSQYVSFKFTEHVAEAEIDRSVGTVGDAYDNTLAERVIGLFKTEVIAQIGPWKSMRDVEWQTLNWVHRDKNRRSLSPIGYILPIQAEEAIYADLNTADVVGRSMKQSPFGKRGAVQVFAVMRQGLARPCAGEKTAKLNANCIDHLGCLIGRTKGGLTTKLSAASNSIVRSPKVLKTEGKAHVDTAAAALPASFPAARWMIPDHGCDTAWIIQALRHKGICAYILGRTSCGKAIRNTK